MQRRIVDGDGTGQMLGLVLTLRAIAAIQMGEQDEGIWHWQVAQQLFPDVADYQLSAYGDVGPLLKEHPPRTWETAAEVKIRPGITRPVKKKAPQPEFPPGRRAVRKPVNVVVSAVIGVDGRPRLPMILQSKGELTMVVITLDAMRRWVFEPARLNGENVPVLFTLSAKFAMR